MCVNNRVQLLNEARREWIWGKFGKFTLEKPPEERLPRRVGRSTMRRRTAKKQGYPATIHLLTDSSRIEFSSEVQVSSWRA